MPPWPGPPHRPRERAGRRAPPRTASRWRPRPGRLRRRPQRPRSSPPGRVPRLAARPAGRRPSPATRPRPRTTGPRRNPPGRRRGGPAPPPARHDGQRPGARAGARGARWAAATAPVLTPVERGEGRPTRVASARRTASRVEGNHLPLIGVQGVQVCIVRISSNEADAQRPPARPGGRARHTDRCSYHSLPTIKAGNPEGGDALSVRVGELVALGLVAAGPSGRAAKAVVSHGCGRYRCGSRPLPSVVLPRLDRCGRPDSHAVAPSRRHLRPVDDDGHAARLE
jgi:hypothetical protein